MISKCGPAVLALNGLLYVFGGIFSEVFNPLLNSWSNATNPPGFFSIATASPRAGAAVVNGTIYWVGGLVSATTATNALYAYNPTTG